MPIYLNIGGLIAAGFDESGEYLLTVSHSGRGVFSTKTWSKVARDSTLPYPVGGCVAGIGPIAGQAVPVTEKNYETDEFNLITPDGTFNLSYESGTLTVSTADELP